MSYQPTAISTQSLRIKKGDLVKVTTGNSQG